MNPVEIIAALLGVINMLLVIRRNIWNFPVALVMVALYALVFHDVHLYGDMTLQGFFFAVNLYGWWAWSRVDRADGEIPVRRLGVAALIRWIIGIVVVTLLFGALLAGWTSAALPYPDAGVAVGSVAAQILLARRFVENWPLWAAVDALAIAVYAAKGLYPTVCLYTLFLVLALIGWRSWARAPRSQAAVPA
ncbi:nicotinamide riboside transporter PnuC [Sphingomonas sp. 1P06PA]|uniref:nicotinamide riboside transporter PnuC n=1 Tax=Sphingomonas sp. 1P06PA TaxID=554121 RepID=UPI0039A63F74